MKKNSLNLKITIRDVYSDIFTMCMYIVMKHKVPQFVELKMVCKGYEEMTQIFERQHVYESNTAMAFTIFKNYLPQCRI